MTHNLFYTVNCAAVGDSNIHHIRVPVVATFAELKRRLIAASLALLEMPSESVALLLAQRNDNRRMTAMDPEINAIMVAADLETLFDLGIIYLDDSRRVAEIFTTQHHQQPLDIDVIAVPLGNIPRVHALSRCIRWLRRLQTAAAAVFVPSSIWAAVDAIGTQSLGLAACVAATCTAVAGAAITAIEVYRAQRARAVAETAVTPIAELRAASVV